MPWWGCVRPIRARGLMGNKKCAALLCSVPALGWGGHGGGFFAVAAGVAGVSSWRRLGASRVRRSRARVEPRNRDSCFARRAWMQGLCASARLHCTCVELAVRMPVRPSRHERCMPFLPHNGQCVPRAKPDRERPLYVSSRVTARTAPCQTKHVSGRGGLLSTQLRRRAPRIR